jgi:hypothetical protein
VGVGAVGQKVKSSFLKKRSKRLLLMQLLHLARGVATGA